MKYTTALTAAILSLLTTTTSALPQPNSLSSSSPTTLAPRALPDKNKNPYYYAAITTIYDFLTGSVDYDADHGELIYEVNPSTKDPTHPTSWKTTIVEFVFNEAWSENARCRFQLLVDGSSTSTTFRVEGQYRKFHLYTTDAEFLRDTPKWDEHEGPYNPIIRRGYIGTFQVPDRGGLATLVAGNQEFSCPKRDVNRRHSFALIPESQGSREVVMWDKVGAGAYVELAVAL
ncbi:hypothetical protein B0J11DRAFT_572621 [Dendryphion nanum]|uniref:Ubiquitin 3 binding protein But2 C-terminal domain-containing protein n=1 Tax=Dendryphion nanum TaxID=256645 RepID=A0A9P9D7H8_9PLEO|nr:hypothetical protein B0J11DRAFT_572621 [Dendryphion nanum]